MIFNKNFYFVDHFKEMSYIDNDDKLAKAVKKLASLKNLSKCSVKTKNALFISLIIYKGTISSFL